MSRTKYLYGTDERLASERVYSNEKLLSETTYSYDQGKLNIQSTTHVPSGQLEVINFEYDGQGNLARKIIIQLSTEGTQKSRVTYSHTYTEVLP